MASIPDALKDQVLSLPDADFYTADRDSLRARRRLAAKHAFEGMAIACPARLEDSRFPILMLQVLRSGRVASVPPYDNAVVVASPLGRGAVGVGPYFPRAPKEKNPSPQAATEETDGEEVTLRSLLLEDVSRRVRLPASGRAAVRVLAWDQRSNTVLVDLDRQDEDEPVEEGYTLDDALPFGPKPDAAEPGGPDVEGVGVALDFPGRWRAEREAEGDRPFVVRGALRVAVDAGALVEPRWRVRDRSDPGTPPPPAPEVLPRAILSGAVVVVRRGHLAPAQIHLRIPVYRDAPVQAGDVVEAPFAVDLARTLARLPADVYQVYAVFGAHLAGPHVLVVERP